MRYTFTGAFAPHICGLIEKKQALGYDYHGSACIPNDLLLWSQTYRSQTAPKKGCQLV